MEKQKIKYHGVDAWGNRIPIVTATKPGKGETIPGVALNRSSASVIVDGRAIQMPFSETDVRITRMPNCKGAQRFRVMPVRESRSPDFE